MKIIIIAAVGKNGELGKDNHLIWKISKDLEYFKNVTLNQTILMGRRTFESLGRLLPKRKHIVLTTDENFKINGVEVFHSIDDFLDNYEGKEDIYVIGGGAIYKQFLDIASTLLLTEIEEEDFEADTYFPDFDREDYEMSILKEEEENGMTFKFVKYDKK